jgi:hypothetical protein
MKRPRSQNGLCAEDYASYLWEYHWLHPAGVYLAAAEGRLKQRARALYEQLYGIKYNDKKLIDRKFTELLVDGFRNAMASKPTSPDISMPLYILLAYFLRQGGGGRDRGRVKLLQIPEDKIAELRAKFPWVPISSSRKLNRRKERETKIYVPLRGPQFYWTPSAAKSP